MAFPYTTKMESIGVFLNHIANDGKPTKVDLNHLRSIGLTSSNDRPLIPLFKAMGFVNPDGTPTARWSQYRDKSAAKAVLAEGIREAYPELFAQFPDAQNRAGDQVKNLVKAKTSLGDPGADSVYRTFRTLNGFADYSGISADSDGGSNEGKSGGRGSGDKAARQTIPQVAINIQLQLPPDANEDTYDRLFEAMAKHLKL